MTKIMNNKHWDMLWSAMMLALCVAEVGVGVINDNFLVILVGCFTCVAGVKVLVRLLQRLD